MIPRFFHLLRSYSCGILIRTETKTVPEVEGEAVEKVY